MTSAIASPIALGWGQCSSLGKSDTDASMIGSLRSHRLTLLHGPASSPGQSSRELPLGDRQPHGRHIHASAFLHISQISALLLRINTEKTAGFGTETQGWKIDTILNRPLIQGLYVFVTRPEKEAWINGDPVLI
jgi:hypothetical protein